jgi:hypothetical protein
MRSLAQPGRSIKFPTYYLVGTIRGRDAYWHPAEGYAYEEIQERRLVAINKEDRSAIVWRDDDDFAALVRDVEASTGRLREAMDADLLAHVDAILEDHEYAAECERERQASVAEANAALVGATELR